MNKIISLLIIVFIATFLLSPFLVALVRSAEDSWTIMEPMSTARRGLGVAVVNGKIYAIGGYNYGSGYLGINEEYDPATNTWVTKTSMPTPRDSFGIAVVESKIYVIGGTNGDYMGTDVNEVYDPETDTWETKTSMPTSRYNLDANVVNGKIYMIGGFQYIAPYDRLVVNEVYDPVTDSWTTKTSISTGVMDYASAVVDNKIYIMGDAVNPTNLNQVYDPETDTWSSGAPLPTGVDSAAAGVTAGTTATERIFVIGGKQGIDAVKLNQVYDPETDTWVAGTAMPTARYGLGVAVVDDSLYAIGGVEGWIGTPISAANERYTPADFVPEFPSWMPMLVVLVVFSVAVVIYKRRLRPQTN